MRKILFILCFSISTFYAQEGKYEKIKALKTAYITETLSLTAAEAQRFWPVYNNFDEKFQAIRLQKRNEIYQKLRNGLENLSDAEADELLDKFFNLEAQELALQKQKTAELRNIISSKKIIGLRKAEDDFKKKLLDRYRQGKERKENR